jgi:hypothetical protein
MTEVSYLIERDSLGEMKVSSIHDPDGFKMQHKKSAKGIPIAHG